MFKKLLLTFICPVIIYNLSCTPDTINIQSYILRNRIIITDQVLMKKALCVSFSFSEKSADSKNVNIRGQLLNGGRMVSEAILRVFGESNGNLIFDLPYEIPEGQYTIKIDAFTENGNLLARGLTTVERAELKNYFYPKSKNVVVVFDEIPAHPEPEEVEATSRNKSIGYILFSRSPLEYVFPESRPKKSEIIDHLGIQVVRNEFEPISFSLYPLRDLGVVKISVSDLLGAGGSISKDNIKVAYVESVEETVGLAEGKFVKLPTLIRPGDQVNIEAGKCQRFWLTIRIADHVSAGAYKGMISIMPQNGSKTLLPLEVAVVPITLEDIPGIDYFMLMTYEFTELTMPWTNEEKEKIYKSACNILKNYKEHGMTTLCLHSPFVLITNEDGTPNLEDIFAALRAGREIGFKRPIIWYMGHLIQTAKPKHPGSIVNFDKEIHLWRLKYLVETVSKYARAHDCSDIVFLPIDEPGDSYQDFQKKRQTIAPVLLKTIKELGAKSMLTAHSYKQFKPVDYLCSGEMNKEDLNAAHKDGSVYWLYNNDVTTRCLNPTYARYIYGYYTWVNGVDGMSSWTFQNTQNTRGLPTRADVSGSDIYLAYPDPNGPLSSLKWEAIREGIDDYKLIYQLIKRIQKLTSKGIDVSKYEHFLFQLKRKEGAPNCQIGEDQEWNSHFFKKSRDQLISLILDAETRSNKI